MRRGWGYRPVSEMANEPSDNGTRIQECRILVAQQHHFEKLMMTAIVFFFGAASFVAGKLPEGRLHTEERLAYAALLLALLLLFAHLFLLLGQAVAAISRLILKNPDLVPSMSSMYSRIGLREKVGLSVIVTLPFPTAGYIAGRLVQHPCARTAGLFAVGGIFLIWILPTLIGIWDDLDGD